MDFSNIFTLLSNINNKQNNNVNKNYNNNINNNSNESNNLSINKNNPSTNNYPYGDFPFNYTVEGQKKLKNSIIKTSNYNFNQEENNSKSLNQSNLQSNNNQNSINQLLPLITGLLGNKSQKSNNVFNNILPLLTGNNVDLANIINQTKNISKFQDTNSENKLPESDYNRIENYQRVE